jgi:hypothetical protein
MRRSPHTQDSSDHRRNHQNNKNTFKLLDTGDKAKMNRLLMESGHVTGCATEGAAYFPCQVVPLTIDARDRAEKILTRKKAEDHFP